MSPRSTSPAPPVSWKSPSKRASTWRACSPRRWNARRRKSMTGIVIVVHAPLGDAMREFAEHVLGEAAGQMAVHDIQPDETPDDRAPAVLRDILAADSGAGVLRSEEHTSELQSRENLVCRLLLEK